MSDRCFVDTNVLAYCFDAADPKKQARALELLGGAWAEVDLVLSTQVLQELCVTVTRKLEEPLSPEDAERALAELVQLPVVATDAALVMAAVATSRRHQLSLWDAMILEAAVAAGCSLLLTEDLQDGAVLRGVRIKNPFTDI